MGIVYWGLRFVYVGLGFGVIRYRTDNITLSSLKKISKELGENMSDEELKDMLERASKNGVELTFEEFYDIMTKKSFP